jgi:elongator complex protein 3
MSERKGMAADLRGRQSFDPERYERELLDIISEVRPLPAVSQRDLQRILRKHPRDGKGFFSRSELIAGFRHLAARRGWDDETKFVEKLRLRRVRTLSGVAPVTVLTKPFPCPGLCIFCPSDVRMPKSYLALEPGAQRAAQQHFDPYLQTRVRLQAYHELGHPVDKVELIVLGGTWSFYPESYRIWFIKRCLDALNDFGDPARAPLPASVPEPDFRQLRESIRGGRPGSSYNQVVSAYLRRALAGSLVGAEERASWEELERAQLENEGRSCRAIGIALETRPDQVTQDEVVALRRLGATKIQIGVQSLSDAVLSKNRRGHNVATTKTAIERLRGAGFKIHAHWMPNLYGSTPGADKDDFDRLFDDPAIRPDELKIYPCSLIESAELMRHYEAGCWRPYTRAELIDVLEHALQRTPSYCRLSRVIRDFSAGDIVAGSRTGNLREVVEERLAARGLRPNDIRSREIRAAEVDASRATYSAKAYETPLGTESFLSFTDPDDRLLAFLRLTLPRRHASIDEIRRSALIREVHVYGAMARIGERGTERAQHRGFGRRLVARAAELARNVGYADLAVISAIGTRPYYDRLGFERGPLYQHLPLQAGAVPALTR